MSTVDEGHKLRRVLLNMMRGQVPVQTVWAKVKEVDWGKKTMTATGEVDDLDYYDVLLGLGQPVTIEGGDGQTIVGYKLIKPKAGSLCLLGIVNNQEAATYLINAVEVEEEVITIGEDYSLTAKNVYVDAESTVFNGGDNGGVPIAQSVTDRLNAIEQDINALKDIFIQWAQSPQDGGGALKVLLCGALAPALPLPGKWATTNLSETQATDIENERVKH